MGPQFTVFPVLFSELNQSHHRERHRLQWREVPFPNRDRLRFHPRSLEFQQTSLVRDDSQGTPHNERRSLLRLLLRQTELRSDFRQLPSDEPL